MPTHLVTSLVLVEMFSEIAAALTENRDALRQLGDIDGNGRHGDAMLLAFSLLETELATLDPGATGAWEVLDRAAEAMIGIDGDAARLYASGFRRAGTAMMRKDALTQQDFGTAFAEIASGIHAHGQSGGSSRNMLDIWKSAEAGYRQAESQGLTVGACLTQALEAGEAGLPLGAVLSGAQAFATQEAKADASAASALLIIRAMRDALS